MAEPILEPLLRWLRFNSAKKYFLNRDLIFDFGCGPTPEFYKYLKQHKIYFRKYVGFDPLLAAGKTGKKFELLKNKKDIRGKFDLITMFAVLEHLPYPNFDFSFLSKISQPGTILIITTPAPGIGEYILEFLSFKLHWVSEREISEHAHYFPRREIISLFAKYGFKKIEDRSFECGLNNLVVFEKKQIQ
jgi:SAM-dependent methyltransferase